MGLLSPDRGQTGSWQPRGYSRSRAPPHRASSPGWQEADGWAQPGAAGPGSPALRFPTAARRRGSAEVLAQPSPSCARRTLRAAVSSARPLPFGTRIKREKERNGRNREKEGCQIPLIRWLQHEHGHRATNPCALQAPTHGERSLTVCRAPRLTT